MHMRLGFYPALLKDWPATPQTALLPPVPAELITMSRCPLLVRDADYNIEHIFHDITCPLRPQVALEFCAPLGPGKADYRERKR